jgi:hypothetical protein
MRVANNFPLGCFTFLPFGTVNSVQTQKVLVGVQGARAQYLCARAQLLQLQRGANRSIGPLTMRPAPSPTAVSASLRLGCVLAVLLTFEPVLFCPRGVWGESTCTGIVSTRACFC